jgi:hypothetical protein
MKTTGWKLLGALTAMACLSVQAKAGTTTANLNIDVSIGGSKSVTVNGTGTPTASTSTTQSFSGLGANALYANLSTASVQNNSGILSEGWELSSGNSLDAVSGAGAWTLGSSTAPLPGAETFALQAVFGSSMTSSCPLTSGTEWNSTATAPLLTASPVPYTSTTFADSNLATGGANTYKPDDTVAFKMYASNATGAGNRALCYRLILPLSTAASDTQIVQIVVTAN